MDLEKEKENGSAVFSGGDIPVLKVEGKTLPQVWENSLVEVWAKGIAIKTQYDRTIDPPSRDATMIMVIHEPFAEPRIHRALPTGLDELEIYRQEVVDGIHNHWVGSHGWSYSYHDRLFNYAIADGKLDQIAAAVENLVACGYTRRHRQSHGIQKLMPNIMNLPAFRGFGFVYSKTLKRDLFLI